MIVVPNYTVIVPVIPDLNLRTKPRSDLTGDRGELSYSVAVTDPLAAITQIELPWDPAAPEWVEVFVDGFRMVNPRIRSKGLPAINSGGTLYERYNVVGRTIYFTVPVSGTIKIICDTKGTPWWGGLVLDPKNVQSLVATKIMSNIVTSGWTIIGGYRKGFNTTISYEPGPKFDANTYVTVDGCVPTGFNGNIKVIDSTYGSITFRANTAGVDTMKQTGNISGFSSEFTTYTSISNGLYSEPVVLTEPVHGYARLSADRQSIVYVPDYNYVGMDTFSWTLITQHGQIGDPKCVYIKVRAQP
jgi:hypothetical protein